MFKQDNKSINIDREIEFVNGVKYLILTYGEKDFANVYWRPQFYKNGFPIIKKPSTSIEKDFVRISKKIENPPKHTIEEIENYNQEINKIIKKTNFNLIDYSTFSDKQLENYKSAIYRYYVIGALNNISLSVSPKIKKKMKINFELFGSFYNTNLDYCGLFDDIENNSCDFNTFKLKKDMIILINPPYTEKWIKISCIVIDNIMKQNKNTIVWLVIPIWNNTDRKKLGLKIYNDVEDLVEIDKLKKSKYLVFHKITNLEFFNGIEKKFVYLDRKSVV